MAHSVPGFPIVVLYMVSVSILRFYSFVVSWQVCNFPVFTWAVPDQCYRSEKHYLTSAAIKKKEKSNRSSLNCARFNQITLRKACAVLNHCFRREKGAFRDQF